MSLSVSKCSLEDKVPLPSSCPPKIFKIHKEKILKPMIRYILHNIPNQIPNLSFNPARKYCVCPKQPSKILIMDHIKNEVFDALEIAFFSLAYQPPIQ
uniref:Uncharacterized protein n=1 Tax=Rhizophora mucronata TaxID=61149 RepID=A0A2P2NIU1_RHIMU